MPDPARRQETRETAAIEFRRVLCPIDFSELSGRALTYAAAFAAWYGAALDVVYVAVGPAEDVSPLWPGMVSEPRVIDDAMRGRIEVAVRRAIASAGADRVNPTVRVEEGRAHETIVQRARDWDADLVVMGTHGRSGLNRLLLGSVTEKVLRAAPCPVLTVPPAAEPMTDAPVALKRILCPIDYSPSALKALKYALNLGRQAGGRVTVLHSLEYGDPPDADEPSILDPPGVVEHRRRRLQLTNQARDRLQAQLADESRTWCEIEDVIVIGRAYKTILQHAAEADLIVMGAQGTSGLALMVYGSNTQHVLRAATCPVLTVHA